MQWSVRKHFAMRAMRLAVETTLKQVTGRRFRFGAPVGGNEIGILPGFLKNSLDYHELFNAWLSADWLSRFNTRKETAGTGLCSYRVRGVDGIFRAFDCRILYGLYLGISVFYF